MIEKGRRSGRLMLSYQAAIVATAVWIIVWTLPISINMSTIRQEEVQSVPHPPQPPRKNTADTSGKEALVTKPSMDIDSRPSFVIHVGPPKTGTTFLQSTLCGIKITTEIQDPFFYLLKDGYSYIGTCGGMGQRNETVKHAQHFFFLPAISTNLNPKFRHLIKQQYSRRLNVLLIYEGFHRLESNQIQMLKSFLESTGFHMRVLVAYRPLYEWLPSKYNSVSKSSRNPSATIWPGTHKQIGKRNVTGAPLLPFDMDNLGSFSESVIRPIEKEQLHITHSTLRAYQRHGIDAQVFFVDPSKSGDHVSYLLCEVLNTTHTCKAYLDGAIKVSIMKNPSTPFDGDMIAVAAHQKGLIPSTIDRNHAATKAQQFYKYMTSNNSSSPYTKCLPNATLERIYQLSWKTQNKLFQQELPSMSSPSMSQLEHEHREGFSKNLHRFCHANTEQILRDSSWLNFLRTFRPSDN